MHKLYVLDASAYLYRSYHAIRHITNAQGESTNALFGFVQSVQALIADFKPTHLVVVFDGPRSTKKRLELYSEYKAHRKETPPDLYYQIEWAHKYCELMGIPQLNVPEVEADDVMGSVAVWAAKGVHVYLCTSDKDFGQLVSDQVSMLNTYKDNLVLGPKEVEEFYGVPPHQMVDFLAITGDASDNVPGIVGFGPKTAAQLLKQMGTLENILQNPQAVSGKKKQETIENSREIALLSKQLVTIDTAVPFPAEEDFFVVRSPDLPHLKEFFAKMNFNSLLKRLDASVNQAANQAIDQAPAAQILPKREFVESFENDMEKDAQNIAAQADSSKHKQEFLQGTLFDLEPRILSPASSPSGQAENLSYMLVDDESALEDLLQELGRHSEICFDTETTHIHPLKAELVGVGFCVEPKVAWYIPVNGQLGLQKVLGALKPLFENSHKGFYAHNAKYDYLVLGNYGITVKNICFDTMLASYLLNSHSRRHSLDTLALECFGKVKIDIQSLIGRGKKEISMRDVPIEKVCTYCCEDVDYTCRLKHLLAGQLAERKLGHLLKDIEIPLMHVLAGMERRGIYIDVPYLRNMSVQFAHLIQGLGEDIFALAGERFNLNSPKQLSQVLFVKMGLKPPRKTATGFSTDVDVLESLKAQHPIAAKLLEYRSLEKLRSTYIDALPGEVNPLTHRIHCNFNQSVAATGRLASQDPNLQNIPVRSELGRQIRGAFCPQLAGWSYLAADYSQIELRILAHMSEDPNLVAAFENGEDVHAYTASIIFDVPLKEVSKEQRYQAKAVNFGVIYGQQAFGLSQELGVDVKSAAAFIEMYFQRYPRVKEFVEESKARAHLTGKSVTLTGRAKGSFPR